MLKRNHFYRPQTKFAKVMFLQVSVCPQRGGHAWLLPGGGGACMVAWGGVHGCSRGGMHGCLGGLGCVVAPGGHAWLLQGGMRGCSWGGMHGCSGGMHGCSRGGMRGCSWGGMHGCSWGGMHGCSQGGHAWLLPGGHGLLGGGCVFFSMRYGQWAGGTHPTGMHSCCEWFSPVSIAISQILQMIFEKI